MCLLIKAKNHVHDDFDPALAIAYAIDMALVTSSAKRPSVFHQWLVEGKGMCEMPERNDHVPKRL